jgi:hypothetical protein
MNTALEKVANILRENGYYVDSPGEWRKDTPARELHLATNIETILSRNYKDGETPGDLTPKSFENGELTIGDLAEDFMQYRFQLEDLHLMGARWMRELKDALEETGALKSSE